MCQIVSKDMIRSTLLQCWKPLENLTFKVLSENWFLIEFDNPKDKEQVLIGRP